MENAYRILMEKPEGKRRLGRPSRRWVDDIKMDLGEIEWSGMDCIDVAHGRDHRCIVTALHATITNYGKH
jgi:hypothetical protein